MRTTRFIASAASMALTAVIALIAASALPRPAAAAPLSPEGNDFIVRVPASEVEGLAQRLGLEIVASLDAAPDGSERGVFLLRAPRSAPPELILEDVRQDSAGVVGVEEAFLAVIPETLAGQELSLSTAEAVDRLQEAIAFASPPLEIDGGWSGAASLRQFDPVEHLADGSVKYKKKKIKFEMEHTPDTDPDAYRLVAGFAEGCEVEYGGPDVADGRLHFKGRKLWWHLVNGGDGDLTISSLELEWPAENGSLTKIILGEENLFKRRQSPPSTVVDSGWEGTASDRRLAPGATSVLQFDFRGNALISQSEYRLKVSFAEGGTAEFQPPPEAGGCDVYARGELGFVDNFVTWQLTNSSEAIVTLDRVLIDWPARNGRIENVTIEDLELAAPEAPLVSALAEHGKDAFGQKRHLWKGYVEQAAATVLRARDARGSHHGEGVVVAIIDTGVDEEHPLLAHRLVEGYDFLRDEPAIASEWDAALDDSIADALEDSTMAVAAGVELVALDEATFLFLDGEEADELAAASVPAAFGHGTMVAGIVHHVAPGASLMPLRVFDAEGRGHLFDVLRAIYWAADHGAHVINMSFGLETFSPELMRAVNYAARQGVACIAAAGNHGDEIIAFPAALGNALGVASTSVADELSPFSNHGTDLVTVAAPGESLVTAFPGGGWALVSGTSYAAPWISGAAAVFADRNGRDGRPGKADYYLVNDALSHAAPVHGFGERRVGHGRADLKQAADKLKDGLASSAPQQDLYPISVDFSERCWVEFPPAAGGGECSASVASQLGFDGRKVDLEITNTGDVTITLGRIAISWPQANGVLKKIKLGGDEIYDKELPPPAANVRSGWRNPDESGHFQIRPGETRVLRFEFDAAAVTG